MLLLELCLNSEASTQDLLDGAHLPSSHVPLLPPWLNHHVIAPFHATAIAIYQA